MDGTVQGRWRRLEHQVSSTIASARGEARLLLARTECLQRAVRLSEGLAVRDILWEFADLDLDQVVGEVVAVLRECLIVMITTTGTGALIGGVAGGLGGAGVGAVPGAALGATAGAQLGEWVLAFMGLKALATYIVQEMPRIARLYWRGIGEAWRAARPSSLPQQSVHEDNAAIGRAAESIARGHVAMFVLLLAGIVAYLSTGKGNLGALTKSVSTSKLGPKFARWLERNGQRLESDPRLRVRIRSGAAGTTGNEPNAGSTSSTPGRRAPKRPPQDAPATKPTKADTRTAEPRGLADLEIRGLKAKNIHYGTNGKVAVIGRTMGTATRAGVRDYGTGLTDLGYKTELFDGPNIPKQALDEFQQVAAQAKQDFEAGLRSDPYLSPDEVKETMLYQENVRWAAKLKAQDYTVVDLGNPYGLGSSAFYDAETSLLFPGTK